MAWDKWDDRFLEVAKLAAEWSKDPNAKVGAVIVELSTSNRGCLVQRVPDQS